MSKVSEPLEAHLRDAMARAATELPLQAEGRAASQRLVNRELSRSPGAGHPRRRRIITPTVAGLATLVLAGTATAATVASLRDNTDQEFRTLHPDKSR